MWQAFKLLAKLKFLRGTALDVFGRTEERRLERQVIEDYRATIEALLPKLSESNLAQAVELANVPEQIRGFGHVKLDNLQKAKTRWKELEGALQGGPAGPGASNAPTRPLRAA
jgi:indolepyruvate ferredoxin oxidoreductase